MEMVNYILTRKKKKKNNFIQISASLKPLPSLPAGLLLEDATHISVKVIQETINELRSVVVPLMHGKTLVEHVSTI
jgi:hypothetical protein